MKILTSTLVLLFFAHFSSCFGQTYYSDSTLNEIHQFLIDFKAAIDTGKRKKIKEFIYPTESDRGDIVGKTAEHILNNNENKYGNFSYSSRAYDLILDSFYVHFQPVPDKILKVLLRKDDQRRVLEQFDQNQIAILDVQSAHVILLLGRKEIKLFFWENMNALLDMEKSAFTKQEILSELDNLDKAGLNDMFTCNTKYFCVIKGEEFARIETDFELVDPKIKTVTVREMSLKVEHDIEAYRRKKIYPQDYDNPSNLIDFASLVRFLDEEHPELFRASNEELRSCIPSDLPLILSIDEWHHQPYSAFGGIPPSSYETFQLIAEVLISRDAQKWKPTLPANNNWRNWPDAGGL